MNSVADAAAASGRDFALDMVKGLLVVGMLLWHAANISTMDPTMVQWLYIHVFGFISGGWTFTAGFIIGYFYRGRAAGNRSLVSRRLVYRGARLIGLVLIANLVLGRLSLLAADGSFAPNADLWRFLDVSMDGIAFEVLIGIGYTLMAGPIFLYSRWAGLILTACVLVLSLFRHEFGAQSQLLSYMLPCGFLGIAAGLLSPRGYLDTLRRDDRAFASAIAMGLSCWAIHQFYLVVLGGTVKDAIIYPLWVCGMILWLYALATRLRWPGWAQAPFTLMAEYALVCYMGQIALLILWIQLTAGVAALQTFSVTFGIVLLAMLASVWFLHRLRDASRLVDQGYRLLFG